MYQIETARGALEKIKEGNFDLTPDEINSHPIVSRCRDLESELYQLLGGRAVYSHVIGELRKIPNERELENFIVAFGPGTKTGFLGFGSSYLIQRGIRRLYNMFRTPIEDAIKYGIERDSWLDGLGLYLEENGLDFIDFMLKIKDLARGSTGYMSDMDLAFAINVHKFRNVDPRKQMDLTELMIHIYDPIEFLINPLIHRYISEKGYPENTAHIDWMYNVYPTELLKYPEDFPDRNKLPRPLLPEPQHLRTDTYTPHYIKTYVLGYNDVTPVSVPIKPITNMRVYRSLMRKWDKFEPMPQRITTL